MTHTYSLTCQELLASISDYVDGSLSPELCQEIERHIRGCENCRVVLDTTTKTLYLYRQSAEKIALPGEVQERLMSALDLSEFFK
ncbi:MAG: anti-sigma factor [Anaerolineae bacterium CG_4_9_14_3_um_filter_57_17]|nr:zf-HC2 domain-containing protein [bacterium]NCT20645.1 zf-HC2 domain-containing protein [bacterium]OIO85686.1 MAG: hypothetical protein AUK01_05570 [Anaerolineae bacterium CG2_30_57_67]PJB64603.1 MAG: anti-sigma factor [Anaerolineae bacterium CG_4_9_14_3_um_filter_57_17]